MLNQNQRKREFLTYLLENHHHANATVTYFLNFLRVQPNFIDCVKFSEQVKFSPRGIYISYQKQTAVPFLYFKNKLSYTSCEQAFHDLRLNQQFTREPYYLELNIPNYYQNLYRFDIFEDNPYVPVDKHQNQIIDTYLTELSSGALLSQLREQLDHAIDQHQFEQAEYLLNQIERIKGALDED